MCNINPFVFWLHLSAVLLDGLCYSVATPYQAPRRVSQSFQEIHHVIIIIMANITNEDVGWYVYWTLPHTVVSVYLAGAGPSLPQGAGNFQARLNSYPTCFRNSQTGLLLDIRQ